MNINILNEIQVQALSKDIAKELRFIIDKEHEEVTSNKEAFSNEVKETDHILLELAAKLESEKQFMVDLGYDNMPTDTKEEYAIFENLIDTLIRAIDSRIDFLYEEKYPIIKKYTALAFYDSDVLDDFIISNLVTMKVADRDSIVTEVLDKCRKYIALHYNVIL